MSQRPRRASTVHYTVVVKDNGPATSTGATAHDVLPSGLIFKNATASVGSYATSTGIWTVGNLAPSSTATLVYAAVVDPSIHATTTIVNSVSVSESASTTDPVVGNNTASVGFLVVPNATTSTTSTPSADLSISKTADVTLDDGRRSRQLHHSREGQWSRDINRCRSDRYLALDAYLCFGDLIGRLLREARRGSGPS